MRLILSGINRRFYGRARIQRQGITSYANICKSQIEGRMVKDQYEIQFRDKQDSCNMLSRSANKQLDWIEEHNDNRVTKKENAY